MVKFRIDFDNCQYVSVNFAIKFEFSYYFQPENLQSEDLHHLPLNQIFHTIDRNWDGTYNEFNIQPWPLQSVRYITGNRQIAKNNRMKTPLGRELPPISCTFFLRLFPFGVVMNKEMRILGAGDKLLQAWGGTASILSKHVTEIFKLRRPKGISFTWGNVSNSREATSALKAIFSLMVPRHAQNGNLHTYAFR